MTLGVVTSLLVVFVWDFFFCWKRNGFIVHWYNNNDFNMSPWGVHCVPESAVVHLRTVSSYSPYVYVYRTRLLLFMLAVLTSNHRSQTRTSWLWHWRGVNAAEIFQTVFLCKYRPQQFHSTPPPNKHTQKIFPRGLFGFAVLEAKGWSATTYFAYHVTAY